MPTPDKPISADEMLCHRCGSELTPGEGTFWIVRIDAVCDPSPPRVDDAESLESLAADYEMMIAEMSQMSERELMDQVHRRTVLHLCTACFQTWYDAPVG
jgi:hypothetical protein